MYTILLQRYVTLHFTCWQSVIFYRLFRIKTRNFLNVISYINVITDYFNDPHRYVFIPYCLSIGLKTFLVWSSAMQLVPLPSTTKHAETTRWNEQSLWANRYLRNCTRTTRHLVSDVSWRLCMIRTFTQLAWGEPSFINLVYTSLRQIKFQCQIQESIHSVT
jgi:hypothetical protein